MRSIFGVVRQKSMRLRLASLVVATSSIAAVAFAQDQNQKKFTVDELVAKNVEAKGGMEALHALQSLKLTGKILVNEGKIVFSYVAIKARPNKLRTEATLQGLTQVDAYDGKEGWKISPFSGRKDPERSTTDDSKTLEEDAELDGPLVDWK